MTVLVPAPAEIVRRLRAQPSVLVLTGLLLAVLVAPALAAAAHPGVPTVHGGLYGLGLVGGCALALQAVAVVLVYRTNRIVNFAQVQMGMLAALIAMDFNRAHIFLKVAQFACSGCAGGDLVDAPGAPQTINFVLSVLVGLAAAPGIGFLCYALVIKRFRDAPRLVVTLITIALAQALVVVVGTLQSWVPFLLGDSSATSTGAIVPPFDVAVRWPPILFHLSDILYLVAGAATFGFLAVFLRRSAAGTVIRAASENTERALTLGVRVDRLTAIIWMLAGTLSGVAAIIGGIAEPIQIRSLNVIQMVVILAAVVAAGLVSLPLAVFASLVLGMVQEAASWTLQSSAVFDGGLLVLICILLLVQRSRGSRAELEAASAWRATKEVRPIPPELRSLPAVRRSLRWGAAAVIVVVLGLPMALDSSQTIVASGIMDFAIVALSMMVLTGWAGQISLGQMAVAALGAFAGIMTAGALPFPLPLLAGGLGGGLGALLVGIPAIRLRGLHLAIVTLALSVTVTNFLLSPAFLGRVLPATLGRPLFLGIDLQDERAFYYVSIAVLIICALAVMGLRRSRTARALLACRDNELAAQSFGLNLVRIRLQAFLIAGVIAGIGGALYAYHERALAPGSFPPEASVQLFLAAVLGGFGSIAGPIIGTVWVYSLQQVPVTLVQWLTNGPGLILLLLVANGGLVEVIYSARDTLLRRLAVRHRIVVPSLLADLRIGPARGELRANRWRTGAQRFTPMRYRMAGQWIGRDDATEENVRPEDENVFAKIMGDGAATAGQGVEA